MPLNSAIPTEFNDVVWLVKLLRLLYRNRSADMLIYSCCAVDPTGVSGFEESLESVP